MLVLCIGRNEFGQLGGAAADDVVALLSVKDDSNVLNASTTTSCCSSGSQCYTWGLPLYGEGGLPLYGEGVTAAAATTTIALGGNTSASVNADGSTVQLRGIISGTLHFTNRIVQVAVGVRIVLFLAGVTGKVYETFDGKSIRSHDELPRPVTFVAAGDATVAVVDIANQSFTWGNALGSGGAGQYLDRAVRIDAFDGLPTLSGRCSSDENVGVVQSVCISSRSICFLLESGDVYLSPPLTIDDKTIGLVSDLPGDIVQIGAGHRHFTFRTKLGHVYLLGIAPVETLESGPTPSIGPPCTDAIPPPEGTLIGSLGSEKGWGLLYNTPLVVQLNLQKLLRLLGVTDTYRAISLAASGTTTLISLQEIKRMREQG
jgi:hypothetical protein